MMTNVSEVYSRGRWRQAAALEVDAHTIVITGKWLKVASVRSEAWLEAELPNPDRCASELIRQKGQIGCADILTFGKKLHDTGPKQSYPIDCDSVANVCLTNIDHR